jgi:O-antigen/teichoic acid export membrane protein
MVAGGTAIAQVVAAASSPILSRLYDPKDFGVLSFFTAVVSVLVILGSWRYEQAIPVAKRDRQASNLLALSIALLLMMSLATLVVTLLFGGRIAQLIGDPSIGKFIFLIPLGLLGSGGYQAFNFLAIRQQSYARISTTKITQGIGMVLSQVGLGLLHAGAFGLLCGDIIGRSGGVFSLARGAWRDNRAAFSGISLPRMRTVARTFRDFPRFSTVNALLGGAAMHLPGLLFPIAFGTAVAGHYFLAFRVLAIPITLVSQSFTTVFYQKACTYHHAGNSLKKLVLMVYASLIGLALIPAVILFVYSPDLFAVVFGENYRVSGEYARFILPWLLVVLAVQPTSVVFQVIGAQRWLTVIEVFGFSLRASVIAIALFMNDALLGIGLYSLAGILINVVMAITILHLVAKGNR